MPLIRNVILGVLIGPHGLNLLNADMSEYQQT